MSSTCLSNLRTLLELISFISAPALVIIAIIALKQISIAKSDVQVRSRREAASFAATQCQRYATEIIPLLDEWDVARKKKQIPEYLGEITDFCRDDLLRMPEWATEWFSKNDGETNLCVNILNSLESFAIYFTKGVADEEIAFSSVGLTYCDSVRDLYPLIAVIRSKAEPKHFEHIVVLYKLWSDRLEKYNLKDQLDEVQSKLLSIEEQSIKPIGTNF